MANQPSDEMLNDPEGQQLVQAIHDRKKTYSPFAGLGQSKATTQQKCPYCEEMLTYELKRVETEPNERGGTSYTLNFQTDPESTKHVWTHASEGASK